jgi:hypothetical protein
MDQHQIIPNRRDKFDRELREIQESCLGYHHTYFGPTEGIRLKYDCVLYKISGMNDNKANNKTYINHPVFDVTVISKDPETSVPWAIQNYFEQCSPGKFYVSDNLYHFPFTIIY